MGKFAKVMSREVTIKELEAERRALGRDLDDLNRRGGGGKTTGGIPLPIVEQKKYPVGPKPAGKGSKPSRRRESAPFRPLAESRHG